MSTALPEMWQLRFVGLSGDAVAIAGSRDVLEPARDEWLAALEACDGTTSKALTVHGITDTADRAETQLTIVVEQVKAVFLTRMT